MSVRGGSVSREGKRMKRFEMYFYICFSETLRKTQEKINNSYTKTMAFYRKSGSECTMEQLSKGTPTRVSIATMLEWISDLNQLFYELYPW